MSAAIFYSSMLMISGTHKRSVCRVWVVLGAVLACAHLLLGVQGAEQVRAPQESTKEVQIELDPETNWISLDINRCIPHNPSTKKASGCIAELHTRFSSLSDEQKTQLFCVNIENKSSECGSGCCEALIVHLVHELAEIEGLQVSELYVTNSSTADATMPEELFTENPGCLLVVQNLSVCSVSSACFHSICSAVQVWFFNEASEYGISVSGVRRIDFTNHPLARPWIVPRISISNTAVVDLGTQVYYLPSDAAGKYLVHPGLWVQKEVSIEGRALNYLITATIEVLVNAGVALKVDTESLGVSMPRTQSLSDLFPALHDATRWMRKIPASSRTRKYVVVNNPSIDFTQTGIFELAKSFNEFIQNNQRPADEPQAPQECSGHAVELRATAEDAPFMCVGAERRHGVREIPWVVRVEQEVLESPRACAAAAANLSPHDENVHVMEAIAVLKHIEDALSDPFSPFSAGIPGGRGMTLLPCGCFKENVLNKVWHRGLDLCPPHVRQEYRRFPQITVWRSEDGSMAVDIPTVVPLPALFAEEPNAACQVDASGSSLSIQVGAAGQEFGVRASRHCAAQIRTQIWRAVTSLLEKSRFVTLSQITITTQAPMPMARWGYVCMHILGALAEELAEKSEALDTLVIQARLINLDCGKQTRYQKATAADVAGRITRILTRIQQIKTGTLHLDEAVFKHVETVSQVVQTQKLFLKMMPETTVEMYVVSEGMESEESGSGGARSAQVYVHAITTQLVKCPWQLSTVGFNGKHHVRVGVPQVVFLPEVNANPQWQAAKLEVEGAAVFSKVEAIPAYFGWRKRTGQKIKNRGIVVYYVVTGNSAMDIREEVKKALGAFSQEEKEIYMVVFRMDVPHAGNEDDALFLDELKKKVKKWKKSDMRVSIRKYSGMVVDII